MSEIYTRLARKSKRNTKIKKTLEVSMGLKGSPQLKWEISQDWLFFMKAKKTLRFKTHRVSTAHNTPPFTDSFHS